MILYLLISSLSICMSCCSKLFPDEKLTMQREDYTGNELKIDGYYYCYFERTDVTAICFLYRNGIIISASGYLGSELNGIEKEMVAYYPKLNSKIYWGIFSINSNTIQYEKWIESPSGINAAINRRSGYIENDTTFHITDSYYSGTKETEQVDEVWHFKQFANKPDSTNNYIK